MLCFGMRIEHLPQNQDLLNEDLVSPRLLIMYLFNFPDLMLRGDQALRHDANLLLAMDGAIRGHWMLCGWSFLTNLRQIALPVASEVWMCKF